MSSQIQSIFGKYTDGMQAMIDSSLDQFEPIYWKKYFTWAPIQQSLTIETIIGKSRINAAASIVDRNSQTPERARPGFDTVSSKIPSIREKISLNEDEHRNFIAMQYAPIDDATKKEQLLDLLFGDVKTVGNSLHKRLDYMVMDALSTGKISMNITNNPDGIVMPDIDLGMAASQKTQAPVKWATTATAKPITDILTLVNQYKAQGKLFSKIIMSDAAFMKFVLTDEVKAYMAPYFGGSVKTVPTLANANVVLSANNLPIIEINSEIIGVEKDAKITTYQPFNQNVAVFVPSGPLGSIRNALAMEQFKKVSTVQYATYERGLISKWSENEPWKEWTKGELNACPSVDAIDQIHILTIEF